MDWIIWTLVAWILASVPLGMRIGRALAEASADLEIPGRAPRPVRQPTPRRAARRLATVRAQAGRPRQAIPSVRVGWSPLPMLPG